MKAAVIQFPGSNCDQDALHVLKDVLEVDARLVWHQETDLRNFDLVLLPGGFAYGDYLRPGTLAAVSPIMREVVSMAKRGGFVLGICNGFQILLEAALLPGTMLPNKSRRFVCKDVVLSVASNRTPFLQDFDKTTRFKMPVAHQAGNYYTDARGLEVLVENEQIALQYVTDDATLKGAASPNGSLHDIAALTNERGNVFGMMPHPERAAESILGGRDGAIFLQSIINYLS